MYTRDDVMGIVSQVDFLTSQLSYFHLGQVTVADVRPYMDSTYTIMEVYMYIHDIVCIVVHVHCFFLPSISSLIKTCTCTLHALYHATFMLYQKGLIVLSVCTCNIF